MELLKDDLADTGSAPQSALPASIATEQSARAPPRNLRVGLFADSSLQPRWVVEAFDKVAASGIADIVILATGARRMPQAPWGWRLYSRLDERCFGSRASLLRPTELKAHVRAAHVVELPAPDAEAAARALWQTCVAGLELDVAFVLGAVDTALLDGAARHGVWRFRFGWAQGERDAGVWETLRGDPLTFCGLAARHRQAGEMLVYRSWSLTHPLSVSRTRQNILSKCAELPARALRNLHSNEPWAITGTPVAAVEQALLREGAPDAANAGALARLGVRFVRRALQKLLCVDQWFVAYRFGVPAGWSNDVRHYRWLMPPRDRLWADPFPIERNGRHYIFFEELPFVTGKGHIAMIEVRPDGTSSQPVRVLERDYHLSYPFLVELGGELYMIPETQQNRTVEVYRCIDFPLHWRLERTLMSGARCADATFHRAQGRWWMFVNIGFEGAEAYDELHVFHADALLGAWRPHARNPVKSDARSARPAGRLFECGGMLYRPAQICAPLYGSGVSINRVLELSPQTYLEVEERRILPRQGSGILGLHTVNRAGELSVIDAFVRRARV